MTVYASTFGTVRDSVIKKLRLDTTLDTSRAGEWVNQAYVEACTETRCLVTSATATLTANTASYTLPAPVLHIEELTLTDGGGQVYPPLVQAPLDRILRLRQFNTAVGPPRVYALVGINQLEFFPAGRATDTLTFWYSYLPDALSDAGDVSLLPEPFGSKLLEYGALVQGAEFKKDPLLSDWQGIYAEWLQKFQRFVNRRAGTYPQAFEVWGSADAYGPSDRSSDWNLSSPGAPWGL